MMQEEAVSESMIERVIRQAQGALNEHLRQLVYAIDATSAWVCYFDFATNQSTVCGGYVRPEANEAEQVLDIGAVYYEQSVDFVHWLADKNPMPQLLLIDDLAHDDTDWQDYIQQGIRAVVFVPIIIEGRAWGYLEVWESRYRREFSKVSLSRARIAAERIAQIIATEVKRP